MARLNEVDASLGGLLHHVIADSARYKGVRAFLDSRRDIALAISADYGNAVNGVVSVRVSDGIGTDGLFDLVGEILKAHLLVKLADSAELALAECASVEHTEKVAEAVVDSTRHLVGSCVEGEYRNAALDELYHLSRGGVILCNRGYWAENKRMVGDDKIEALLDGVVDDLLGHVKDAQSAANLGGGVGRAHKAIVVPFFRKYRRDLIRKYCV